MKGMKTGGRRKGSTNKITSTVKDNVIAVFEEIGGVGEMKVWAMENRTEFYRLYAKLLPTDLNVRADVQHHFAEEGDELARKLSTARAVTQSVGSTTH